jgi:putative ABC transport system substrate-binding protein
MAIHIRRREFIVALGGAATWPLAARAQQPAMPVIGFLNAGSTNGYARHVSAFRQGLRESGFVEGQNTAIEFRWADGRYDLLPSLMAELVRQQVAVIAANLQAAVVAKAATSTIPIIFGIASDPIKSGLVASLARPASNVTGVTTMGVEVAPKRLELLHELVPTVSTVPLLINPTNQNVDTVMRDHQMAARVLGLQLHILHASSDSDIEMAFAKIVQLPARALVISPDPFFNSRSEQLAALALRFSVPSIYQYREFAAAGGLMSYGGSITAMWRLVGAYTGRVLKDEKPANLPVQQATKLELILNLKTAKALGLDVPTTLLASADEVME